MPQWAAYEENHSFFGRIRRDHRSYDSTSLRSQATNAVRDADADSPNRMRCAGEYRYGQNRDGDEGGFFALHDRWYSTDWRAIRSRHANSIR